jgi:hypothetical protein
VAINASVITDTAKDITKRLVVDYGAGVFAHTTQDWIKHNCIAIRTDAYTGGSGETISTDSLRLLATLDDGSSNGLDQAVVCPLNPAGTSAITNAPPIIIQQPASKVAPPNSTVQLLVAVISDITVTYQWYKKNDVNAFVAISGATASKLVLTNVTDANSGDYRVVATNANGSTTSSTANVLVSAGASGGSDGQGWYEQLPGVRLTKAIFGLF